MTRRPRGSGARLGGFTLVEVLVALVVMAIMAVMAWQGVDGITRTRNASQARLEATLRLDSVVAQWDQDLAAIQDTGSVPDALDCNGASVRLTRHTPDGVQLIVWTLRPDTNGNTSNWERWASPAVTSSGELNEFWLLSQQLQGNEAASLRTLTGLSAWQVYFYRGNAWTNCQSTGDVVTGTTGGSGSSTTTGTPNAGGSSTPQATTSQRVLPDGVRVVLSFAPGSGTNGDLTRDTLLKR
jgi:general secretion pathway protein J